MARLAKAWPCLVGAVLFNLAFAPFNLGLLVFAAFVPWLLSLRESTPREGFRSGLTLGFLTMLGQMFWLCSFVDRWTHSFALALVPYLLACAYLTSFFGLVGCLIAMCWRLKAPWMIPIVWAGIEVFRSYIPAMSFPYSLIATPLWPYPTIIQSAYYGSIYMVGAWVMLANVILALFLKGDLPWLKIRNYLAVFILGLLISFGRFQMDPGGEPVVVTVGQPGADLAFGVKEQNDALLNQAVAAFFTEARKQHAALLVLPEGIAGSDGSFPPKPVFQVEEGMPVIFGGQRGEAPRYQTAFGYDGHWSYADKSRLVIFGEYVPFREELPFIAKVFQMPGGDLAPADEVKALKVGTLTAGPVICFEALFPDVAYRQARNGVELLTVMSVDDWYFGSNAPDQLRAASIWRAVETGLPLVRAASLGYSFAVDAKGQILAEIPVGVSQSVSVKIRRAKANPFPLFPVFPIAAFLSLIAIPVVYKRKLSRDLSI